MSVIKVQNILCLIWNNILMLTETIRVYLILNNLRGKHIISLHKKTGYIR